MTITATSATRKLTMIVLCSLLVFLFPLSVSAQEASDPAENMEGVAFLNPETSDVLFIIVEQWETPGDVAFQMRIYENDNLVEGFLGEGIEVVNSSLLSEEDATEWGIEGGLVFEVDSPDGPATIYALPIETDVVIVMYMGEGLSDRRLNRFVGDVAEDGVDVRTPRGFERIDDIEEFFD